MSKSTTSETPMCKGVWIYGETGVGKSYGVRRYFEKLGMRIFIKQSNKWWDGYAGEPIVLIDDLDSDCLHHYLKLWMDKYPTTGEIKGGTVPLLFKYLVVTSNYTIEHLFQNQ